jgi:hypothetical protein
MQRLRVESEFIRGIGDDRLESQLVATLKSESSVGNESARIEF